MTDDCDGAGADQVPPDRESGAAHGFAFVKPPRSEMSRISEQLGAFVPPETATLDLVRDSALRVGAFADVHRQLEALAGAFTRISPISKTILAEAERRNAFADMLPKVPSLPQVDRSYLHGDVLTDLERVRRERRAARVAREEQTIRLLEENLQRQDAQLDISRQLVGELTSRRHTTRLLGFTTVAAVSANFAETWGGKLLALAAAAVVYGISEVVDRKARGPHPV